MALSNGYTSITLEEVLRHHSEVDILFYYLGILKLPCVINSPLRKDAKPSFGLFSKDGSSVKYRDFATGDSGGLFDLLGKLWHCTFKEVLNQIVRDLYNIPKGSVHISSLSHIKSLSSYSHITNNSQSSEEYWGVSANTSLQVKIRDWRDYDIAYWESYGIPLIYLKYAEVYPISHTFIIEKETNQTKYVISSDKYAYVFVEHKEGQTTMKVYQPFNKEGHKWYTKHDRSVVGLWMKVPEYGEQICICSSLKDALCLWINTGIPSLYLQGEGYGMSNTAINELKRRYKKIYICFDNDTAGINNGIRLSEQTEFINVVLPQFEGGKDLSDLYHIQGKDKFVSIVKPLFI